MLDLPFAKDKAYYVVGLARSGLAACRALFRAGARVYAWDDTNQGARDEAATMGAQVLPPHEAPWEDLGALVLSPGIAHLNPLPHESATLARAAHVPIICDLDLLFQLPTGARTICVTGTNGKSTTTALIAHILTQAGHPVQMGGNIGVPVLDLTPLPKGGFYVLEMSSYQLERVPHMRAHVGVLLNLTPDHLSRHGGWAGYIEAKERLLLQGTPFMVMGQDDEETRILFEKHAPRLEACTVHLHERKAGTLYVAGPSLVDARWEEARTIVTLRDVKDHLPGLHNAQNILAAYGACRAVGISFEACQKGILSFLGLAHRIERLGEVKGVTFINDSKGTNGQATSNALRALQDISWIVGGVAKEDGLEAVQDQLPRVRHAYLIGQSQDDFAKALEGHVPYTKCTTLDQAVARAMEDLAGKTGTLLLSPACASFDQFADFEARGNAFRALFESYHGKEGAQ